MLGAPSMTSTAAAAMCQHRFKLISRLFLRQCVPYGDPLTEISREKLGALVVAVRPGKATWHLGLIQMLAHREGS